MTELLKKKKKTCSENLEEMSFGELAMRVGGVRCYQEYYCISQEQEQEQVKHSDLYDDDGQVRLWLKIDSLVSRYYFSLLVGRKRG